MPHPEPIERLIGELVKLPGIGRRTAERLAFHLVRAPAEDAYRLAVAIRDVRRGLVPCSVCAHVTPQDPCPVCADPERDRRRLLVVEHSRDIDAFEAAGWKGLYHVLGGTIDPVEGVVAEDLTIDRLLERVRSGAFEEVVLGLDADFEGDGTATWLALRLRETGVRVTRLARGVPSGSTIERVNASVLAAALDDRRTVGDPAS